MQVVYPGLIPSIHMVLQVLSVVIPEHSQEYPTSTIRFGPKPTKSCKAFSQGVEEIAQSLGLMCCMQEAWVQSSVLYGPQASTYFHLKNKTKQISQLRNLLVGSFQ